MPTETVTASLATNYNGEFDVPAGVVSATGTEITPMLSLSRAGYKIAYPGAATTINVVLNGSVSDPNNASNSVAFNNTSVVFKQAAALEAAGSYTLVIKFVNPLRWAGSNIYWDDDELTFDLHGNNANKDYQGVLFKWGSLVGISPMRGAGNNVAFTADIPIYEPDYSTGTWTKNTSHPGVWADIPSLAEENIPAGQCGPDKDYFRFLSDGETADLYEAQKGDICRYLSATNQNLSGHSYQMPTWEELAYGTINNERTVVYDKSDWTKTPPIYNRWTREGNNWTGNMAIFTDKDDGTYKHSPSWGANIGAGAHAAFFPVSTYRMPGGSLDDNPNKSTTVNLASASAGNTWRADEGTDLTFYEIYLAYSGLPLLDTGVADPISRQRAYPIRCVVKSE
jgi:hypothetical protein